MPKNIWEAFYNFSAKNINTIDFVSTVRVNKSLINDFDKLMMLWPTGPINITLPGQSDFAIMEFLVLAFLRCFNWDSLMLSIRGFIHEVQVRFINKYIIYDTFCLHHSSLILANKPWSMSCDPTENKVKTCHTSTGIIFKIQNIITDVTTSRGRTYVRITCFKRK